MSSASAETSKNLKQIGDLFVGVLLPPDLAEEVRRLAAERECSLAAVVRAACRRGLRVAEPEPTR